MSINIDNLLSKIKSRTLLPEIEVKIICDKVNHFKIKKTNFLINSFNYDIYICLLIGKINFY